MGEWWEKKCELSHKTLNFQISSVEPPQISRRQARGKFWNLRCDSLLPESIPDCKSVEIAQNFPPPAGSFSETSKKGYKKFASGGVIHNVTSTEAPRTALFHNITSTEAARAVLFHNMTLTEAPRVTLFYNITSTEVSRMALFHNMTSNFYRNFNYFF